MKPTVLGCIAALVSACASPRSIYKRPETEAAVLNAYTDRLAAWPVAYQSRYVGTSYGVAHVLVTGAQGARPLVLLHAMGLGSPMWRANIAALSREHRVFAIDFIGDLGRSRLQADAHPSDGPEVAAWLCEVLDRLSIARADVVGASYGGWAALQLAAHRPERVGRIALLGPMGIAPVTGEVVSRLASLVLFPTEQKKDEMVRWTLGDNPASRAEFESYMRVAMDCESTLAMPSELSDETLRGIRAPVLLLLGEHDGPIGPPARAEARAKGLLQSVRVVVIPAAGHVMNVEAPEVVDAELLHFLSAGDGAHANPQRS